MLNNLKETRVQRQDTCFTYALKRVGLEGAYDTTEELPSTCFIPFNIKDIKVGSIVAWKNQTPRKLFNTSIHTMHNYPVLVQHQEFTAYHVGIIERVSQDGCIIISDCVRNLNTNSYPEIRLRLLDTKLAEPDPRFPDFIIII